ncbi:HigA family addiction module antitoxin [Parabacteroides pacaensis]|uniref:HigA family addiction module antitoxin n=1 Tax=Parabacteroides pacaensis TaxID=2086575 RepID=UPI000D0EB9A6|nr:HigA family addiction module antitoxin [Parabacteroides pacaensis]
MITIKGVDPRMIANNLTPFEPTHPGEMIKDEIEYRGLSQRKLAAQMGISPTLLNEILNGKRAVSTQYALLFEAALGIDAEIWIRLQAQYDMQVAKSDKSFLERLANIRKLSAVL